MFRRFLILSFLMAVVGMPSTAFSETLQVIVSQVRVMQLADRIEALGTLRANESARLTATTTDTIAEIRFEDGQRVSEGDVLVVLNHHEQLAERAETRAAAEEARRQHERVKDLAKRGTASASLLDQRRREYDTALARVQAAEARVSDRLIVAPFDGVVGLRNLSVGSLLTPDTVVTSLHDDSVMKLDFTVPELFVASVAPGLTIEAQSRAFPGEVFRGEVVSVSNEIDPVTRAFRVRALIPNPERRLRPGMLLTLSLARAERDAHVVPEEALLTRGREHSVFVILGSGETLHAERRIVQIGTRVPGVVEIVAGLEAGERVVTHGAFRLNDGDEVRIKAVDDGSAPLSELLARDVLESVAQ
ncbi:MAG TPA: efflux RND transporter periplasmic adaptor subunit [Azoarcus sp.]|nr:efflux RND transporter periplasmic adaptor subunit [Azoarcus sp.]